MNWWDASPEVQLTDDMEEWLKRQVEPKKQTAPTVKKPTASAFDPEGSGYDYETAKKLGLGPDASGKWPDRDPKTGLILRGKEHSGFYQQDLAPQKVEMTGKRLSVSYQDGSKIVKGEDGRYYVKPKEVKSEEAVTSSVPEMTPPEQSTETLVQKAAKLPYEAGKAVSKAVGDWWNDAPAVDTKENVSRSYLESMSEAWKRGDRDSVISQLKYDASVGLRDEEEVRKAVAEAESIDFNDPITSSNWFSKASKGVARMLPAMIKGLREGGAYGAGLAGITALAGQAGPQAALPEELVTVPAAFGTGMAVGSTMYWYRQGAGDMYWDMRQNGISKTKASILAQAGGVPYALIEQSQIDKIIPGLGKVAKDVVKQSIMKALGKKALKAGVNIATEVGEEGLQQIVQDSTTAIGKLLDDKMKLGEIPAESFQIAKNALNTAYESIGPMTLLQLPGGAVGGARTVSQISKAQKAAAIENLPAWIEQNPEEAKKLATIEKPSRNQWPKSLPRMTGEERADVSAAVKKMLEPQVLEQIDVEETKPGVWYPAQKEEVAPVAEEAKKPTQTVADIPVTETKEAVTAEKKPEAVIPTTEKVEEKRTEALIERLKTRISKKAYNQSKTAGFTDDEIAEIISPVLTDDSFSAISALKDARLKRSKEKYMALPKEERARREKEAKKREKERRAEEQREKDEEERIASLTTEERLVEGRGTPYDYVQVAEEEANNLGLETEGSSGASKYFRLPNGRRLRISDHDWRPQYFGGDDISFRIDKLEEKTPENIRAKIREFIDNNPYVDEDAEIEAEINKMVEDNLDTAKKVANRYKIPGMSKEDIQQEATLLLKKAAETYDEAKGVKFDAWARKVISSKLKTLYTKQQKTVGKEVSIDKTEGEEDIPMVEKLAAPETEEKMGQDEKDILIEAVRGLSERQQALVKGFQEGRTDVELAEELGISKQAVNKQRQKAFATLKNMMEAKGIKPSAISKMISDVPVERRFSPSQIQEAIPGSKVTKIADKNGWKVELPNGKSFNVEVSEDIPISIPDLMSAYNVSREEAENMVVKGVTIPSGVRLTLSDGTSVTPSEVMVLIDPKNADNTTARHEALHVAKELGLFETEEGKKVWDALEKEYGDEEGIAAAREAWEGPKGLWERIRRFIKELLANLGFDLDAQTAMAQTFTKEFWAQVAEGEDRMGLAYQTDESISAMDSEYMDAVNSGDMEKAQEMVDEAARKAGYDAGPVFHGTSRDFNKFLPEKGSSNTGAKNGVMGSFFTNSYVVASSFGKNIISAYIKGNRFGVGFFEWNKDGSLNHFKTRDGYPAFKNWMLNVHRKLGKSADSYNDLSKQDLLDIKQWLMNKGLDGIEINTQIDSKELTKKTTDPRLETWQPHKMFIVFDPSQIKSADPVTYDDKGKVIPLSKRFDYSSPDIRYQATSSDSLWSYPEQNISSADTSINQSQIPASFKRIDWKEGTINADIGGGRFDNATEFLKDKGVENVIYDPFNRSKEHNLKAVSKIRDGRADTATINNVLNVIAEQESRNQVIEQAANAVKGGGKSYFLIYEGDKSGIGKKTTKGWQENRTAESYKSEVGRYFSSVTRKGNMLIASNPRLSYQAAGRINDYSEDFKSDVEKYKYEIEEIKQEIEGARAGYRMPNPAAEGKFNYEATFIGIPSTFPKFFQNKGWTKKFALNVIKKIQNGDFKFGVKQQQFVDALMQEADARLSLTEEQMREDRTVDVMTGDLSLHKGDIITLKKDDKISLFTVIDENDAEIVLESEDGDRFSADPFFDRFTVVGEVIKPSSQLGAIGISKAEVERIREDIGLDPINSMSSQTWNMWIDSALDALSVDKGAADRLVNELTSSNRPISAREAALLAVHQRRIKTYRDKMSNDLAEAQETGDSVLAVRLNTELINSDKKLDIIHHVLRNAGTSAGQTLNAFKILLAEDMSYEGLSRKARDAQGGKPLDSKQEAEIKELAEKIAALEKKVAEYEARVTGAEERLKEIVKEDIAHEKKKRIYKPTKEQASKQQKKAKVFAHFKKAFGDNFNDNPFVQAKVTKAQATKKSETGKASKKQIEITAEQRAVAKEMAEYYALEEGVISFNEFWAQVQLYIKSDSAQYKAVFKEAWDAIENTPEFIAPDLDVTNPGQITRAARAIERRLVENGMTDPDQIVATVQEAMSDILETKNEARDALTGYGQFTKPSQDEVSQTIRDINAQLLKSTHLDLLEAAKARAEQLLEEGKSEDEIRQILRDENLELKKTGFLRDKPSNLVRHLTALVNQAKRELPISTKSAEDQLQTAQDTIKRSLRNRIFDLNYAIDNKERIIRKPSEIAADKEILQLREEKDRLTKIYREMFPPEGATEAQKKAAVLRGLDAAIFEIERQFLTEDFGFKKPAPRISSAEIEEKRARLNELRKQRDDMRKSLGITRKKAQRDYAQNLRNQISKLSAAIKNREEISKSKPSTETSAEIERLKAERDALRTAYNEMFPKEKKELNDAQKDAIVLKGIERDIAEIQRQVKENDLEPKPGAKKRSTAEIEAQRERLAAWKAIRDILRDESGITEKLSRLQYEANLRRQIAAQQEFLARGDFAPKPKKEPRIPSKEELRLRKELADAKQESFKKIAEYHLANLSPLGKAKDIAVETAHLTRAIMTSIDLSAVLRQGGIAVMSHPDLARKASIEMMKAMVSKQAEFNSAEAIRNHELGHFAEMAGLAITEDEGKITRQEEAYMGRWAKRVPGVAASGRAYTTFLNNMRFALFAQMVENLGRNGRVNLDEAKVIASYVNAATGRSDLKALNKIAANMNTIFFAPRWVVSRFQYLAMPFYVPFMKTSRRVKWAIAKEYARTFAGFGIFVGTLMALGYAASDDDKDKPTFETDPRSSDFLKIKIGDTRIDPTSALSSAIVFSSRFILGETKTAKGEIKKFGEGYKPTTRATLVGQFLRYKMAPIPGAAWTAVDLREHDKSGKKYMTNAVGQKVKLLPTSFKDILSGNTLVGGLFLPLSVREVTDAMTGQDIPTGTALSILALLGASASTYGDKTKFMAATPKERKEIFEKDLKNIQWNDKNPAYSEFLSQKYMNMVHRAKALNAGKRVYQYTMPKPERKEGMSDAEYNEKVKKWKEARKKAISQIKGFPENSKRSVFDAYWKSRGYKTGTDSYYKHLRIMEGLSGDVKAQKSTVKEYISRSKMEDAPTNEARVKLFKEDLKKIQWDGPNPGYYDKLSDKQKAQVREAKQRNAGLRVYQMTKSKPKKDKDMSEQEYQEAVADWKEKSKEAYEKIKSLPRSKRKEALDVYWKANGYKIGSKSYRKRLKLLENMPF